MAISHYIFMGIGAVVALYIFVVLVEWIIVKCTGLTLSVSYTKDFGLTFVVIPILFFSFLTWLQVERTMPRPYMRYTTTMVQPALLEFNRIEDEIKAYFASQAQQGTNNYNKKRYNLEEWNGQQLKANQIVEVIGTNHMRGSLYLQLPDGTRGICFCPNKTAYYTDSIKQSNLARYTGELMSRDSFSNLIANKTLDQIDPDTIYRKEVAYVHGKWFAWMAFKVFNDSTGEFFHPILVCDAQKNVEQYIESTCKTYGNAKLLKYAPFASQIYDCKWISWLGNKYLYEHFDVTDLFVQKGILGWLLKIVLRIVFWVVFLVWSCGVCVVPMLLLILPLRFRWIYYWIPDTLLLLIVAIAGIVPTYCIMIILLADYPWFFSVFVLLFGYVTAVLMVNECLSERCGKCRYLFSKSKIDEEILEESFSDWYKKSEYIGVVDKWRKGYTEIETETVVIEDGNGNEVAREVKEREIPHYTDYTEYLYHDYEQRDRRRKVNVTYKCEHCGDITQKVFNRNEVVDRRQIGSHTEVRRS